MKGFISFFAAAIFCLISVNVWACPNLSGNYSCYDDSSEEFPMVISQEETEEGVHIYNINEEVTMVADGEPHEYEEENVANGETLSRCEANKLISNLTGDFVSDKGEKFGEMDIDSILYMTNEDQLVVEQIGVYKFYGTPQDINRVVVCDRE